MKQRLLTLKEIAEYLQVKESTIYQWTHQGYIPYLKLGNQLRFRLAKIEEWLDKRESPGRTRFAVSVLKKE